MALIKAPNLRRPKPLYLRLSDEEKEIVRASAAEVGISMAAWVRCKILKIPFKRVYLVSGRKRTIPKTNTELDKSTKATP